MTGEQLIKRLKRLDSGEYYVDEAMFLKIANKSECSIHPLTGDKIAKLYPLCIFLRAFDECKYGLEYATGGKLRYIGTNDLNTLVVR